MKIWVFRFKFLPRDPTDTITLLVPIMAWRRSTIIWNNDDLVSIGIRRQFMGMFKSKHIQK